MNTLNDIIERCHNRHEKPLRQRKTIVTPAIYKGLTYHFTVYCAYRKPIRLHDLEVANISFMPIGGAPGLDRMPQSFGGQRFLKRQGMKDWEMRQWHTSWGIQIYTGIPSKINDACWHDIEFKYAAICAAPEAVLTCIDKLISTVSSPLLTITKSGGLRFSCRIPNYLHPNTVDKRFYIYKDISTLGTQQQRQVYLEIRGESGHSPWDARYEILHGNLLAPPVIAKEVIFTSLEMLRNELDDSELVRTSDTETFVVSLPSLGSHKLDLAKEAFFKRGYVYLRQENKWHHWTQSTTKKNDTNVLLWEHDGTVWIRATNTDVGLPMVDTPITAVWNDTGILPPIAEMELPVSDNMLAVRDGKLSPLAIKRPDPVLDKPKKTVKTYEPSTDNIEQIQLVLNSERLITAPITPDTGARSNFAIETNLIKSGAVSLSAHIPIVNEASKHFEKQNLLSITRWRRHNYLWDKVKDIPVDLRMATPFQNGNICEDADRCTALVSKGIDPSQTICHQCPVQTACQQCGYLSQSETLQSAKTQLIPHSKVFLDPSLSTFVENILKPVTEKERLCIIDEVRTDELFLDCYIDKNTLETWSTKWKGYTLGNFSQALLNVLEIKSETDDLLVKRIRTVIQAFQNYEVEIIKQMCEINVQCRIVSEKTFDDETNTELAHYKMMFEEDVSAYIPVDNTAADRLIAKGLPVLQLEHGVLQGNTEISIPIEQAVRLGILDTSTAEKIEVLPKTYPNPRWTLWHQLKHFLSYYTRDKNAPMIWYNKYLYFWVPPMLNPNIKQLLLLTPTLSEQNVRRTFPDEQIQVIHIKPNSWIKGNQVFQIRTGTHSLKTILDYNSTWDVVGLSKVGERFMRGICADIRRDPNIKHAIVTYKPIIAQLKDLTGLENLCLLTKFKNLINVEAAFEAAQVIWIVGTPHWEPGVIWRRAQIIYGNDDEPLCYESDTNFQHFKDPRIQHVYIQAVTELITEVIGRAGLNYLPDKKVVLISSLHLPNITDRPETLLFDWNDFEIAGSLDKLAETIVKRQQFETERDNLTAECSREKVEQILGCSSRTANRILQQLRGGNIPRVTFQEQILSLLANGEKKSAEVIAVIDGNPHAINRELVRLAKIGEIVKVRRGVYALPEQCS